MKFLAIRYKVPQFVADIKIRNYMLRKFIFWLESGRMIVMRRVFSDEMDYIRVTRLDFSSKKNDRSTEKEFRFSGREKQEGLDFAQMLDEQLRVYE